MKSAILAALLAFLAPAANAASGISVGAGGTGFGSDVKFIIEEGTFVPSGSWNFEPAVLYVNSAAVVGGGISSVTVNSPILGLGSGASPLRLDSSSVTLTGNTFNGASQLVRLDGSTALPSVTASALTALNASAVTLGSLPNARLDSSSVTLTGNTFNAANKLVQLDGSTALPAVNAAALTALNASQLASGSVPNARLDSASVTLTGNTFNAANKLVQLDGSTALPAVTGTALTALNASNVTTGSLPNARLDSSSVTLTGNTFNAANKLVQLDGSTALPAVTGTALLALNASNMTTGSLPNARLDSSSVTLTGNTFNGASQLVQLNGATELPSVSGANLSSLNATQLSAGTLPNARLDPADVSVTAKLTAGNAISAGTNFRIANSTVVSIAGTGNLFVGVNVGTSNAGTLNAFLGSEAGHANTSGLANTFSGYQAGYANTIGSGNTFFGAAAGSTTVNGNSNTFIGLQAGVSNISGSNNTFLGNGTGGFNTTGANNTFLGDTAGLQNSTGTRNTYVGREAGQNGTTGVDNTFVGRRSGRATVGSNNTFSGSSAGLVNTSGFFNSFYGSFSGQANTTGIENTFVGQAAGFANTTGNVNTFVGYVSGVANTTGTLNSFYGSNSGQANTSGDNNTFIGQSAGILNVAGSHNASLGVNSCLGPNGHFNTCVGSYSGSVNTGTDNTFVGQSAGLANTTGSDNVYIGLAAGYLETTASEKLRIANRTANLVYGDFSTGQVAINATSFTGTEALRVHGGGITVTGAGAPPNDQALCLSGGLLGHCTSIVGVTGGCTCVAP